MLIQYSTIRDVMYPERGHPTDAGIDFFCPVMNNKFCKDFKEIPANSEINNFGHTAIKIPPGANAVIPSGVKVEIPYGHMGLFLNKSGVATKMKLIIGAQVIDTFYSGEVHIDLHNVGTEWATIEPGMKLAQMVIVPAVAATPILCPEEDLYLNMKSESYRDEAGFGSTDKEKDKKDTKK